MTAAAAAAAAAEKRRRHEEEETMTAYRQEDLLADFEFKILRSVTGRFRDPAFLRHSLAEEAKAGWTLVEKFDQSRIRLKRPAAARSGDAALGFDPYRTWIGMTDRQFGLRIFGLAMGTVALLLLLVFAITHR